MAADAGALPAAPWARRSFAPGLSIGLSTLYLSVIVLLPLAALGWRAHGWDAISTPQATAALKLSLGLSFVVALVNAFAGTAIAWTLVRDRFVGQGLVNALVDLPFALPTIVAGLTLLALYGPRSPAGINAAFTRWGLLLALLFVTLPFVVRTVQPVLFELDREMEDAAASLGAGRFTTFLRIILPSILPAILSGVALAFATGGRRVRRGRAHLGEPAVQDGGRVRLRVRPHRERRHGWCRGRLGRHPPDLVRRPARDRRAPSLGDET